MDMARILVDYGAAVDATNGAGQTALHIAAAEGDEPLVKYFYGVRVNASITDNEGMVAMFLYSITVKSTKNRRNSKHLPQYTFLRFLRTHSLLYIEVYLAAEEFVDVTVCSYVIICLLYSEFTALTRFSLTKFLTSDFHLLWF